MVRGDICDFQLVWQLLVNEHVDVVMHFAAQVLSHTTIIALLGLLVMRAYFIVDCSQSHVDNSFDDASTFLESNVIGTLVLLDACTAWMPEKFIHVSTDEVYGETGSNEDPLHELAELQPSNPYSATKAAAEMLVRAAAAYHRLPVIISRANNVYGPGQYPEKVIPKFIRLAKQGKRLPIHGSGRVKRCFLYVDDVCDAFESILESGEVGEAYNIGTDEELTVLELAECVLKECGFESTTHMREYTDDRPYNDQRYFIDFSRLRKLGWAPHTSFIEGLRKTIASTT